MPKPTQEHPDRLWLLLNRHVLRKRRNSQATTYGLEWQGCEGPAEFTVNCGMDEETHHGTWEAPEAVSHSNARTWAEYLDGESACSEVADVPVGLGGGERPLHGKGGHGRTQLAQETSAGHAGSEHRSQPHSEE
jgi:hypothetical protein